MHTLLNRIKISHDYASSAFAVYEFLYGVLYIDLGKKEECASLYIDWFEHKLTTYVG